MHAFQENRSHEIAGRDKSPFFQMDKNEGTFSNFYWQDGYGAFSVNPAEVDVVKAYIENQVARHRKKTFKEELLGFLKEYQMEYDERYLWD